MRASRPRSTPRRPTTRGRTDTRKDICSRSASVMGRAGRPSSSTSIRTSRTLPSQASRTATPPGSGAARPASAPMRTLKLLPGFHDCAWRAPGLAAPLSKSTDTHQPWCQAQCVANPCPRNRRMARRPRLGFCRQASPQCRHRGSSPRTCIRAPGAALAGFGSVGRVRLAPHLADSQAAAHATSCVRQARSGCNQAGCARHVRDPRLQSRARGALTPPTRRTPPATRLPRSTACPPPAAGPNCPDPRWSPRCRCPGQSGSGRAA